MPDEIKKLLPGKRITLSTKERVEIKPVPFGKLPAFTESIAELFSKLKGTGLKLEDIKDWKVVLEIAAEETIRIMAFVIDKPREWFDSIDIADGLEILNTIIEQNITERTKKKSSKSSKHIEFTLTDTIQTLISAGHRFEDIKGYTIEQIRVFGESVLKLRKLELQRLMWAMHLAAQGSSYDVKKHCESLQPVSEKGIDDFLKDHGKGK